MSPVLSPASGGDGFLFNLPIEFPLVIRYDISSGSVVENEDCVQRCEGLLICFCYGGRKLIVCFAYRNWLCLKINSQLSMRNSFPILINLVASWKLTLTSNANNYSGSKSNNTAGISRRVPTLFAYCTIPSLFP